MSDIFSPEQCLKINKNPGGESFMHAKVFSA